jgi:hypothetical protein
MEALVALAGFIPSGGVSAVLRGLLKTPERPEEEDSVEFKKAVKTKSWLRLAIDGVSGSGKTFTAMAIGAGMVKAVGGGGRLAIIDSEHGSASLYADRFDFDSVQLKRFQIEDYIEALDAAATARYPVVIIDSTSHAWDALVERVERIAGQKYGGNTFRAWGEGTPLQKKLIEAMLNYPGHVIVTCRSKTEYSVDKDEKGKTTVKKVGTAAVQRQGFEYEFTMAMTMDANHVGFVTKDRTGKFQDQFIEKPGKEIGGQLIAWLNEGEGPPPPPPDDIGQRSREALTELGNILKGTSDTGEGFFTDDEIKAVKEKLAKFPRTSPEAWLAFINRALDEQKALLQERVELFTSPGASPEEEPPPEDPARSAPPAPAPPPSPPPRPLPAMYSEEEPPEEGPDNGEGPAATEEDDGFEDDLPWEKDPPPLPPRAVRWNGRETRPSLSEGFEEYLRNGKTAKPAAAQKGKELDIF